MEGTKKIRVEPLASSCSQRRTPHGSKKGKRSNVLPGTRYYAFRAALRYQGKAKTLTPVRAPNYLPILISSNLFPKTGFQW